MRVMASCIFCKILSREIPSIIIYEDDVIFAFDDIHPLAPVHVLVIPKEHIPSIADTDEKHTPLMGKMIMVAKQIAEEKGIATSGYKLLIRVKKDGGQEVDHIHLHLIGGAPLIETIRPV